MSLDRGILWPYFTMEYYKISLSVLLWVNFVGLVRCQYASENCDWNIWDYSEEHEGVKNIYAECSEGHIAWNSPSGAMRIYLQSYSKKATFEACFIANSHYSTVKISLEEENNGTLRSLVKLNNSMNMMNREMCFHSSLKPVILYVEAQVGDYQAKTSGHFELDYDIRRIFTKLKSKDEMGECKPCTNEEVLQTICTSDFVLLGSIGAVVHNDEMEESELYIHVNKIHTQRGTIFRRTPAKSLTSSSNGDNNLGLGISFHEQYGGSVIVPRKCDIRKGEGQFMFIGRTRLKRAYLRCAPRYEDFQEMWNKARRVGRNPCSLD